MAKIFSVKKIGGFTVIHLLLVSFEFLATNRENINIGLFFSSNVLYMSTYGGLKYQITFKYVK
jgi:hypothetical protein